MTLDATTADDALACPLCGYDLRGLPEHRCPECGHAFDPDALRQARDARRPWFFEHAPRGRRARAFGLTTRAALDPVGFWGRVTAAGPSSPGRLAAWSMIWALAWAAAIAAILLLLPTRRAAFLRSGVIPQPAALIVSATLAAWPLVALATLHLFGGTLRRAGVRTIHRWRCVLYPLPWLALPAVGYALANAAFELDAVRYYGWPGWARDAADASPKFVRQLLELTAIPPPAALAIAVGAAMATAHFTAAHVRYLRIRHAAGQALLAQAAAWTLIVTALLIVCGRL